MDDTDESADMMDLPDMDSISNDIGKDLGGGDGYNGGGTVSGVHGTTKPSRTGTGADNSSGGSGDGSGSGSGSGSTPSDVLKRNEATLMEDFHYSEYLGMQPTSAKAANTCKSGGKKSIHGSKQSLRGHSYSSTSNNNKSKSTLHSSNNSGYASTDSARSYRRSTIVAHGSSSTGLANSQRERFSSRSRNNRRGSHPPPHHESDSSTNAWSRQEENEDDDNDSDDMDYRRGRGVQKNNKGNKRRSSSGADDGGEHSPSPVYIEGQLKGISSEDSSGSGSGEDGQGKRRFSGHSLASIRLLIPNMDDFCPGASSDIDEGRNNDTARLNNNSSSRQRNRAPPPPPPPPPSPEEETIHLAARTASSPLAGGAPEGATSTAREMAVAVVAKTTFPTTSLRRPTSIPDGRAAPQELDSGIPTPCLVDDRVALVPTEGWKLPRRVVIAPNDGRARRMPARKNPRS